MLHVSHEVKSGHRLGNKRKKRMRRSWAIVAAIVAPILFLVAIGVLTGIDWHALALALTETFLRLLGAYAISLVLGVLMALLIGWSGSTTGFLPFLDVLQNVPSFALIPVFALLLGYSNIMIVVFAATSIIWPIVFYTLSAIQAAHQDLNDAADVFGATGWRRLRYYLFPLSVPAILTGSIVGISIGWESVIGVEIIGNVSGFGSFINHTANHAELFVGIVAILVLVFVINRLIWTPLLSQSTKHYAE